MCTVFVILYSMCTACMLSIIRFDYIQLRAGHVLYSSCSNRSALCQAGVGLSNQLTTRLSTHSLFQVFNGFDCFILISSHDTRHLRRARRGGVLQPVGCCSAQFRSCASVCVRFCLLVSSLINHVAFAVVLFFAFFI